MVTITGAYKLARQAGRRGCYANARVELVEVASARDAETVLAEGDVRWRHSVGFGVDYALALVHETRHFRVTVALHTMAVDSTPAVVAAATARAVLTALDRVDGPLADAEPEAHRVVFPLW